MLRSMMEYFLSSINPSGEDGNVISSAIVLMTIEGFIAALVAIENAHCIAGLGEGELDVFAACHYPTLLSPATVCGAARFFCF